MDCTNLLLIGEGFIGPRLDTGTGGRANFSPRVGRSVREAFKIVR
jgi:hypothetical protein